MPDAADGHLHLAPAHREPPHNLEAEQALLGAILLNNRAYELVSEFLRIEFVGDDLRRTRSGQGGFRAHTCLHRRPSMFSPLRIRAYRLTR